jgi:hypothetical protein
VRIIPFALAALIWLERPFEVRTALLPSPILHRTVSGWGICAVQARAIGNGWGLRPSLRHRARRVAELRDLNRQCGQFFLQGVAFVSWAGHELKNNRMPLRALFTNLGRQTLTGPKAGVR